MTVSTSFDVGAGHERRETVSGPIRLALLSDRALLRESLAHRLAAESGFELIAQCSSMPEAMVQLNGIDVLILDLAAAKDLITAAHGAGYAGKFLVVASAVDAAGSAIVLRQGAAGVFLDGGSSSRLVQAIRLIASGEAWIDPQLLRLLAERYPHYEDRGLSDLTPREEMIVEGLVGGLSNRKIAARIGTSESTIKNTLQLLFGKAGVRTRSQLVRIALDGKRDLEL